MSKQERYVVIVAGGKGTRMGSDVPKQFLPICGIPILMHTIRRFLEYDKSLHVLLVLPSSQCKQWAKLCEKHEFREEIVVIEGGESRLQSVENGLRHVPDGVLVGIHDGVRPLVSRNTIERCYQGAERNGSAIPVVSLTDSIREEGETGTYAVDRSRYHLVQTPQVFRSADLKSSYSHLSTMTEEELGRLTDDASVYEKAGGVIYLVDGNRENIKITTPIDLLIAEVLMKKGRS